MSEENKNEELEEPRWLKLHRAEEDFRHGDSFAVDECVLVCHEDGEAIPDWAIEEFARRARINLGIEEDPSKKGGRHTNPLVKQRELRRRRLVCCAVHGARKRGSAKEKSYDTAKELLEKGLNRNYPKDTIKKVFLKYGSDYDPESVWVMWFDLMVEALETANGNELLEEILEDTMKSLMEKKPL